MNTRSHTHTLEIFSGSLLEKRQGWQRMTRELPANGCLLIMQTDNKSQEQLVHRLGRAFHAQGRRVFVLKVK
jgi:hypothetical protein